MKVIKIGDPASFEKLSIVELADPGRPAAGEVRVAIRAISLNYRDIEIAAGRLPTEVNRIPLADASGVVEALGEGVSTLQVGDHVVSRFFPTWNAGDVPVADFSMTPGDGVDGYGAEFVVRPEHYFSRAPIGLTHAQAATLPVAAVTAWRALVTEGNLKAGDTVLVLGTGGVSIIALQIARAMGAKVIATTSSKEKEKKLLALGATAVVNYKSTPDWSKEVLAITGGKGVDHIVEVGGSGTLQQSIAAVRIGGNILLLGILTGFGGDIDTFSLTMKQIRLKGIVVGSLHDQEQVTRAIEFNRILPVVDKVFPISAIQEAYEYHASGKHFGKVVLEF